MARKENPAQILMGFMADENRQPSKMLDDVVNHGHQRATELAKIVGAAKTCEDKGDRQKLFELAAPRAEELAKFCSALGRYLVDMDLQELSQELAGMGVQLEAG